MNSSNAPFKTFRDVQKFDAERNQDPVGAVLYDYQYASYRYMMLKHTRGLLLMYMMGAGKTLPSVAIAVGLVHANPGLYKHILIVANKSIQANYQGQIELYRDKYLANENAIMQRSDFDKAQSMVRFVTLNDSRLGQRLAKLIGHDGTLSNSIVIVDEAHNFFKAIVNGSVAANMLHDSIMQSTELKLVFLTGTPMVNDPFELVPCINMIKGRDVIANDYNTFIGNYFTTNDITERSMTCKNLWDLQNRCVGTVSYSQGNRTKFPKELDVELVRVQMDPVQLQAFKLALRKEEDGIRAGDLSTLVARTMTSAAQELSKSTNPIAQVVGVATYGVVQGSTDLIDDYLYKTAEEASKAVTQSVVSGGMYLKTGIVNANRRMGDDVLGSFRTVSRMVSNGYVIGSEVHSPKSQAILKSINQREGIHMVYSQYIESGIDFVIHHLQKGQYKKYSKGAHGPQFVVLSGNTSNEDRIDLVAAVNQKDNVNGDRIKVVLITSAAAEGINFKNVRHVHIMEPYWNYSRVKQVVARAVRNNSHYDLPQEQRVVQPYIYLSTESEDVDGIDEYLLKTSHRKQALIEMIEQGLRRVSINCVSQYDDCIICEQTGLPLYDPKNIGTVPMSNPCKPMTQALPDAVQVEVEGRTYHVVKTKPSMTGIDFGWNVYKYNRQMKVFARVSGEVMYEALRKVKTGEIQKEGADLVSGLLSTLE